MAIVRSKNIREIETRPAIDRKSVTKNKLKLATHMMDL